MKSVVNTRLLILVILIIFPLAGASEKLNYTSENINHHSEAIKVGADQYSQYLPFLKNKTVAVLVNQTSYVNVFSDKKKDLREDGQASHRQSEHLVDFLLQNSVEVKQIYAPEHGFRGKANAGEIVGDGNDPKSGIEIISLYGKNKKPTRKQLEGIDWLIFDIQDVGVRFYTYISSLHYFMEACAEFDIPLLILDRPNPNGDYVDGPILENAYKSFVGLHPIPVVHGLTVAELALMINGEGWLSNGKGSKKQCELKIIKVKNYQHSTPYSLPIPPSTNLPNDLSVRLYPSLAFFEATVVSVGRGTPFPFQVVGYPHEDMGEFWFVPEKIKGSWSLLNYSNQRLYGEKLGPNSVKPVGLSMKFLVEWRDKLAAQQIDLVSRPDFMDKLAGNSRLRQQLAKGLSAKEIEQSWAKGLKKYRHMRQSYLLYP